MKRRVAYLGPAGTHTEEALLAGATHEVELLPLATVQDTFRAVSEGEAERGVVPLENSIEGGVGATLDALAAQDGEVRIVGETLLAIRHTLIVRAPLELAKVERVLSHPQALAQCAGFLDERLPTAERVPAPSTAEAVRTVVAQERPWAALGSATSAAVYGGVVLADAVQDRSDNVTRFAWLAPAAEGLTDTARPAKTSIVFWGFNDESPGALVEVLRELSVREINLTRIESRPQRVKLGHYMFFVDLNGHEIDDQIAAALKALRGRVQTLRVLGSYAVVARSS